MQKRLSGKAIALLDLTRALAAIYVVLYHVGVERGWTSGPGVFLRFGQEAVMVFFLLSGFVIFANEKDRATEGFGYFYRRLRRIYPPLVFAILVSVIVALIDGNLIERFDLAQLVGTLLAVQDIAALKPGVIVDPVLGNAALWTLSYEILFYLLFPATMVAWRHYPRATTHFIGLTSCLCYANYVLNPNHWTLVLSYYGVWWAGAMAADAYLRGKRNIVPLAAPMLWLAALCGVAAAAVMIKGYQGLGVYPFLQLRHFTVAFVTIAIGFGPLGVLAARLAFGARKPADAAASISYGIYVLHFPLLIISSLAASTVGLIGMTIVLIALSYVSDRYLNEKLPRWKRPPAALAESRG